MAIDQRHEQLNKDLKSYRGIVGLIVDQDKFNWWFVCTSGVIMVTVEFESQTFFKNNEHRQDFQQHGDSKSFQAQFQKDICNLRK